MLNSMSLKAAVLALSLVASSSAMAGNGTFSLFGDADVVSVKKPKAEYVELSSDPAGEFGYSGISYTPRMKKGHSALLFEDIMNLSAKFQVTAGGIGGGSPRFSIEVDTNHDGTADGNVFVYIGDPPNFTEGTGPIQSTGNLAASTDLRVDTTQLGGPFYGTFDDAVTLVGDAEVLSVDLVVDGSWAVEGGVQTIIVTDMGVNHDRLKLPKPKTGHGHGHDDDDDDDQGENHQH